MLRPRTTAGLALVVSLALVPWANASAQAPQQLKANIRMSGGSLSSPVTGVMYVGGSRVRLEMNVEGEQMTIIHDPASGNMLMLMPSQNMYMEMPAGTAPVSAPRARSLDPTNPCSSPGITGCTAQGEEAVNGYTARKWRYQADGETQTAWIATQLRFPVRIVAEDGTTSDFSNVAPGPQPASLFTVPAGWVKMEMGPMTVMGMGGRGGMPPGAMSGIPPGALAGMDSATIAMMMSGGFNPSTMIPPGADLAGTPWEQGDGWIIDVVITASGSETGTDPARNGTTTRAYSAEYRGSVPLTYGTPGTATPVNAVGPAWQLVATLGSPKALATPLTFSGTSQYRSEESWPAACPNQWGGRVVTVTRGTGQVSTNDHSSLTIAGTQARWQLSADLKTHQLLLAIGGSMTEATETQTTSLDCDTGRTTTENSRSSSEGVGSVGIELSDLPLPATPRRMSGEATVPTRFRIGRFDGNLDARVQWTLRPM